MKRHVIEVLYADRCPRLVPAIARVRRVLGVLSLELDIELRLVRIADLVASPVVRVDGRVLPDPESIAGALGAP